MVFCLMDEEQKNRGFEAVYIAEKAADAWGSESLTWFSSLLVPVCVYPEYHMPSFSLWELICLVW